MRVPMGGALPSSLTEISGVGEVFAERDLNVQVKQYSQQLEFDLQCLECKPKF